MSRMSWTLDPAVGEAWETEGETVGSDPSAAVVAPAVPQAETTIAVAIAARVRPMNRGIGGLRPVRPAGAQEGLRGRRRHRRNALVARASTGDAQIAVGA